MAKRKPNTNDYNDYNMQLRSILVEFAAPSEDVDYEEMFTAYEPNVGGVTLP